MATITPEQLERLWRRDFSACYYLATGSVPFFVVGETPTRDIRMMQQQSDTRTAWFVYNLHDYDLEYWELLEVAEWPGVQCQLSTAAQLSEQLGMECVVPSQWVLHVEKV
jgi:hypothetical protein